MALTISNYAGLDALIVDGIGNSIIDGLPGSPSSSPGYWGALDAPGGLYDQMSPLVAPKTGPSIAVRTATTTGQIARFSGYPGIVTPSILKPASFGKGALGGSSVVYVTDWNGTGSGHPERINDIKWAQFFKRRADLFVIDWAINDYVNIAGGVETAGDHLIAVGAVLDRIHRDYPLAQVLWMGCLFINQAWSSIGGNHFTGQPSIVGSNPFDLTNPVDVNIATACAARPGWTEYVPQLDWTLAYTVATTTEPGPVPGQGWPGNLSMNGLHPTLLCQQLMGQHLMNHINIVTT